MTADRLMCARLTFRSLQYITRNHSGCTSVGVTRAWRNANSKAGLPSANRSLRGHLLHAECSPGGSHREGSGFLRRAQCQSFLDVAVTLVIPFMMFPYKLLSIARKQAVFTETKQWSPAIAGAVPAPIEALWNGKVRDDDIVIGEVKTFF